MRFLAIVGTSHLSEIEEMDARKRITWAIQDFYNNLPYGEHYTIISGGAKGIDSLVKEICKEQFIQFLEILPLKQTWNEFKKRNIKIAEKADHIICISTKIKNQNCYHCNNIAFQHERTGGCWTMKWAKGLNKTTQLIIV